jgi:glycosyltransferase EpsE
MANAPRVSVLMGIYNCSPTLEEAVDSIRQQTFTDWELILCDDGSTDDTLMKAASLAKNDDRIHVIRNSQNLGLARTLDYCASVALGEYFARMDGDDRCSPDRFAKLVEALDEHPEVAVVSSWMSCFDERGTWGVIKTKLHPTPIDFLPGSPICHAPCMMRRNAFNAVGGYGSEPWLLRAEDYHLWFKFYAEGYQALNLQEELYAMRDDQRAQRRRTLRSRLNETIVRWRGFKMLKLSWLKRMWAIRPLLVWAMPSPIYRLLHRRN